VKPYSSTDIEVGTSTDIEVGTFYFTLSVFLSLSRPAFPQRVDGLPNAVDIDHHYTSRQLNCTGCRFCIRLQHRGSFYDRYQLKVLGSLIQAVASGMEFPAMAFRLAQNGTVNAVDDFDDGVVTR